MSQIIQLRISFFPQFGIYFKNLKFSYFNEIKLFCNMSTHSIYIAPRIGIFRKERKRTKKKKRTLRIVTPQPSSFLKYQHKGPFGNGRGGKRRGISAYSITLVGQRTKPKQTEPSIPSILRSSKHKINEYWKQMLILHSYQSTR